MNDNRDNGTTGQRDNGKTSSRRSAISSSRRPVVPSSRKKSSWWVYVVRCKDGTLYCGATNDLEARIEAHNSGLGAKYTRGRGPVELVFRRRLGSKSAAMIEEARIKRLTRDEKLSLFSLAPKRPRR